MFYHYRNAAIRAMLSLAGYASLPSPPSDLLILPGYVAHRSFAAASDLRGPEGLGQSVATFTPWTRESAKLHARWPMLNEKPATAGETAPSDAHLVVTRTSDGRYCVAYIHRGVSRRSYTASVEQVIRQAQRAGSIPVQTDDEALRQRCQEAALPLI